MKLDDINSVYFIGIGGIGMSALARYFKKLDKRVEGYDKTPSRITQELIEEGIAVHFDESMKAIPEMLFLEKQSKVLVVYTPAVPTAHPQLRYLTAAGFHIMKRSAALGIITREHKTIAVAGTHGKTSTSSLIAHILQDSGMGCNAFLGGIVAGYNTNLLFSSEDAWTVLEADEYDRSFLSLNPTMAIITSIDPDHLDIYKDQQHFFDGFQDFANKVSPKGLLFLNESIEGITSSATVLKYGKQEGNDAVFTEAQKRDGQWTFDIRTPKATIENIEFSMPGEHNQANACAAVLACLEVGVEAEAIKKALASFQGIYRRFEYHKNDENGVYIDDYAHHPSELRAAISAARERHPGKKICGIFQAHLYSRTRDFGDEFARSLELLDEVVLLDIYPAREMPIEGIDSQWLLDKISGIPKKCVSKVRLLPELEELHFDVLMTLGAGDIDRLVPEISTWMNTRTSKL